MMNLFLTFLLLVFSMSTIAADSCKNPSEDFLDYEHRISDEEFKNEFPKLEDFESDKEDTIRNYCSCKYEPLLKGDNKDNRELVDAAMIPCLNTVYCAKAEGMSAIAIRNKYSADKIVCSQQQITEWHQYYKKADEEKLDNLTNDNMKKYCGLTDPSKVTRTQKRCLRKLMNAVESPVRSQFAKNCGTNKGWKTCYDLKEQENLNTFVVKNDSKMTVMASLCPSTNGTDSANCLDKVINEFPNTPNCSKERNFPTVEGQKFCRMLVLLPKVGDVDATKTCISSAKDSKEKAACLKDSASVAKKSNSGDGSDISEEILFPKSKSIFKGNGKSDMTEYKSAESAGGASGGSDEEFDLDSMSFRELKKKLDGKMTKSEVKTCYKAYKKGKKELPNATFEEAKKYMADKECKVDILLANLGGTFKGEFFGGDLPIIKTENGFIQASMAPIVITADGSDAGNEVDENAADKPDAFTKGDLKDFLKDKMVSPDEKKACFKSFKKGKKKNPNATTEEAYAFMENNGCPLSKIFDGTNAGSICLAKAKVKPVPDAPIINDEYFYKRYEGACNLNAPEEDQDKILACYAEAKKNANKSKDLFTDCTKREGLDAKYDFMNFKQALKNEFKVAGCEPFYDKIAKAGGAEPATADAEGELKQCIIKRVGQEAAKAILAEFAKDGVYRLLKDECEKKWKDNEEKKKECLVKLKNTSNMIGAFSALGMDTMSCIPPRSVRENGDRPITNAADFCKYLDADGGGSSKYATPTAKAHCQSRATTCTQFTDKADLFQICGMTVVNCTKAWVDSRNGQDPSYNESACSSDGIARGLFNNDRPNPNPNYNTSLCIAGAVSSSLNAFTNVVCSNEKKYPTSEAKEACLKKLQFVNEIGTAGATTAKCMQQGPSPMSDEEEKALEAGVLAGDPAAKEKLGRRQSQIAQRNSCLAQGLGNQAVDLITQQVCNAKKTQEEKEECFKKAGIVKIAGTAAFRIADCQKINKTPYSDAAGNDQAARDYRTCMQSAVLDSAMSALTSELAADVACKKHKDNKEEFEACKNKYKKSMTLVGTGISVAQRMVQCSHITDEKQKQSCMVSSALVAGGALIGQMGDLACEKHKDDPAKYESCKKNYAIAGQVVNVAAATNVVINEIAVCKGDQACIAAVLAKQLPGDAGTYASFAVQGWGLIRQKNTCKVPSKYLYKAGALVKIAGDLTTHIVHKVQSDELKKKYADLVHEEKVQDGSSVYGSLKGLIDSTQKDRAKEKDEERTQQFATQELANEAQLRALAFQRQNEENTLQSSLWQRPFLYGSTALNTSANTMAVFEQMAEIAAKTPQGKAAAPWKECMDSNGEKPPGEGNWGAALSGGSAAVKEKVYRHVNLASVNKSFDGLNNHQAFALYEDYERFINGEIKSISLDEYETMGKLDLEDSGMPMNYSLKMAANFNFNLVPEAHAIDFAVLENIGVNMIGGLFPGSGGFGQGSPVGYAQDITFLFIKEGLDRACDKSKRNPETGKCEYTGKATIEFAAKKAAQALLKQNEKKMTKTMSTPAGRIVIGLWNLGKLVKLVVDNEKIITGQRERVNYLKSQEEQFKAQNTGFNFKPIRPSLQKFMDFVVADAWAKMADSPNNLKVCIGKNTDIDFKCSCRKTGCYNIMPLKDKEFRNSLAAMNGKFGNTFAQGLNATNAIANMMDQLFSGARGTEDINHEQLKVTSEKLGKFNKSLIGAYNNMNVKMGMKPVDFEAHVNTVDKNMFASLPPYIQRNLAGISPGKLSPKLDFHGKTAAEQAEIDKSLDAEVASTPKEEIEPVANAAEEAVKAAETTPEQQEEVQVAKADNEMNEAMTKNYSYSKNDINLDKEISLFKVISGRYHKKKENLHKHD